MPELRRQNVRRTTRQFEGTSRNVYIYEYIPNHNPFDDNARTTHNERCAINAVTHNKPITINTPPVNPLIPYTIPHHVLYGLNDGSRLLPQNDSELYTKFLSNDFAASERDHKFHNFRLTTHIMPYTVTKIANLPPAPPPTIHPRFAKQQFHP